MTRARSNPHVPFTRDVGPLSLLLAVFAGCVGWAQKCLVLGGWLLLGVIAVGTTGCSSAKTIHAKNHSAPTAILRFELGNEAQKVELSGTRTEGDFSQRLNEGETISTGEGEEITGPASLDGNAEIDFATLLIKKVTSFHGGNVGLEGGFGIAYSAARFQLESITRQLSDWQLGGGFGFFLRTEDRRFGMRAGVSVYGSGQSEVQQYELLGRFQLTPKIELLAGFHSIKSRFNEDENLFEEGHSDVLLEYSGPTAGVHVFF